MKRIILLLVICSLLLVSCNQETKLTEAPFGFVGEKYDTLFFTGMVLSYPSDLYPSVPIEKGDINPLLTPQHISNNAQTMSIDLLGKTYIGEYGGIFAKDDYGYVDWLLSEDSPNSFKALRTHSNGELFQIIFADPDSIGEVTYTSNEINDIAKSYASQFIDITKYYFGTDDKSCESEFWTTPAKFTKYIGEYETDDYVTIELFRDGTLKRIEIGHLGAYDNVEFDIGEVMESIEAKKHVLEARLESMLEEFVGSPKKFMRLHDGTLVLKSTYNFTTRLYTKISD